MQSTHILWPILAQILLTILMYVLLAARKAKAIKSGQMNRQAAALDNKAWPEDVVKVSNNIANQFEAPVLFYVLCLIFYAINDVTVTVLTLAWAFVISRYAHAYVHAGSNYVPMRMKFFLFGCLVLLSMVGLAAWQLAVER